MRRRQPPVLVADLTSASIGRMVTVDELVAATAEAQSVGATVADRMPLLNAIRRRVIELGASDAVARAQLEVPKPLGTPAGRVHTYWAVTMAIAEDEREKRRR